MIAPGRASTRVHSGMRTAFMDVRLMAVVDMYGSRGRTLRRRLIMAEFILTAIDLPLLGASMVAGASSAVWALAGAYLMGTGLNFLPLALHSVSLTRGGRLGAYLAGVDVEAELRRYTVEQFLITVPLLVLILSVVQLGETSR